jgi:uncharacterized membrane protein
VLGIIHTAISLIAVGAGVVALINPGTISLRTRAGRVYVVMTILTCLTGLPIFQKGGFGPPHALALITLAVIAGAIALEKGLFQNAVSRYVETIAYSLTFFFHVIPGFTETATRLPAAAPLASGPDDPALQASIGAAFVVFLIGVVAQVRRLRATRA